MIKVRLQEEVSLNHLKQASYKTEFENQSFNLISPGDISEPFSNRLGWHIVKLIEKKTFRNS